MTFGRKLKRYREEAELSQEGLAEKLGVPADAVEKWERDAAYPETEKVIALCKLFAVSADDLLLGSEPQSGESRSPTEGEGYFWGIIRHPGKIRFEYISKKRVGKLPLVHINIGLGCAARGVFALGLVSFGVFALGLVSCGLFAIGLVALGLFAAGTLALGGAAAGAFAVGIAAAGGIAVGVLSVGGIAVGEYALGGLVAGRYVIGGWAHGQIAIGSVHAGGRAAFLMPEQFEELEAYLATLPPADRALPAPPRPHIAVA